MLLSAADVSGRVRDWALDLLDGILEDEGGLRVVRHPLGFACVPAYRADQWGLCLHIWTAPTTVEPIPVATSIHSHTWDLASQVLCGRLENCDVAVTESPANATHRIVKITSVGVLDIVEPTQWLVRSERTSVTEIGTGQSYTLPAGSFHSSTSTAGGLTATVVLGENRLKPPELALGDLETPCYVIERSSYDAGDLRRLTRAAIAEIAAA